MRTTHQDQSTLLHKFCHHIPHSRRKWPKSRLRWEQLKKNIQYRWVCIFNLILKTVSDTDKAIGVVLRRGWWDICTKHLLLQLIDKQHLETFRAGMTCVNSICYPCLKKGQQINKCGVDRRASKLFHQKDNQGKDMCVLIREEDKQPAATATKDQV